MKQKTGKSGKVKKFVLIVLAVIAVIVILNTCITIIYAKKIPHRFASAEEGRELFLANTDYYGNFTQDDIDYRLQKEGGTLDEFLEISTAEIKDFNFFEKRFIEQRIAGMKRKLEKNGYELPQLDEIVFVKTDMSLEGSASGYTCGTQIYLNSVNVAAYTFMSILPEVRRSVDELLWHELFHCLSRNDPEFRKQMYSLINFTVADNDFEIPPSVRDHLLRNPDVEHHDSYATFNIDGKPTECFVAWITPDHYAEVRSKFSVSGITALIPTDGTDTYYTVEQASDFFEVFGENTGYVIDPEECMADNFMFAMLYGIDGKEGKGFPNPEIIQGVIDIVSR